VDSGGQLALLGLLLLAGYAASIVGRRVHVPRVTLLLLIGLAAGPSGLDLAPEALVAWFPTVTHMALAIVGFLLGESFVGKHLKGLSRAVVWVSIGETLAAAAAVLVGLLLVGAPLPLALLLAGIAPATDPAATLDVASERGADGPLTRTLLGVVAIDDAWGVIVFSLMLVAAEAVGGQGAAGTELLRALWEVGGAGLLGAALAFPMVWVTGRGTKGEPHLLEAIGFVFLCAGFADLLGVSYLLASMTLGAVVANRATHYTRPFHAIENVREPFLAVFFVLAGFEFQWAPLLALGAVGVAYVVARSTGLIAGGMLGAKLSGAPPAVTRHVGWCLLPQAGVALGLALVAVQRVPGTEGVLPLVIASTVIFEVLGPMVTLWHISRAGELPPASPGPGG